MEIKVISYKYKTCLSTRISYLGCSLPRGHLNGYTTLFKVVFYGYRDVFRVVELRLCKTVSVEPGHPYPFKFNPTDFVLRFFGFIIFESFEALGNFLEPWRVAPCLIRYPLPLVLVA